MLNLIHFHVDFFVKYPATPEIYTYVHTLSLHDALPIYRSIINQLKHSSTREHQSWSWSGIGETIEAFAARFRKFVAVYGIRRTLATARFRFVTNRPISSVVLAAIDAAADDTGDRKSTRLNSSH